jgi:hypothetical protein
MPAAATEAPAMEMVPMPTATAPVAGDTARIPPTVEAPMEKSAETETPAQPNQPPVESTALIPIGWQIAFLAVSVLGAAIMFALRQSAKRKWQ